MIGLDHEFPIRTCLALSAELLERYHRLMRRGVGQVEKEWFPISGGLGPAIEPLDRLRGKTIKAFDIHKVRRHLEIILGGILRRHLGVRRLDTVIAYGDLVRFLGGVLRRRHLSKAPLKPPQHAVVHRCRDTPIIIEALVQWHILYRLRPVALAPCTGEIHSQMPLTHHGRRVALPAQQRSQSHAAVGNQARAFRAHHSALQGRAPRVAPREQPVP